MSLPSVIEEVSNDFSIGDNETVTGVALRTDRIEGKKLQAAIEFRDADRSQKDRFNHYIMKKQMERVR